MDRFKIGVKMKTKTLTSALLAVLPAVALFAEVKEVEKDSTIVVTAAPLPKYREAKNDAATLIDLPSEKVPFTVDTLTEDFIRERNVTDLDQLLALQPGIYQGGKTMMQRQSGTYSIRGFGRSEVLMGGVPLAGGAAIYMDPSLLQRVDIVKGPVGGAYGSATSNGSQSDIGGVGGTIILTPKQASFDGDFYDFSLRGSYSKASGSRAKVMADVNRVNEEGNVAIRVPVAYEWRDPGWAPSGARHGTMFTAAPSISYMLTERLTAGLDLFYQYSDQPAYQGVRTKFGKPYASGWDDTYALPEDRMKFMTFGGTFRLDGELNDWVKSRTRLSYFQTHTDYNYRGPFSNLAFDPTSETFSVRGRGGMSSPRYEWGRGDMIHRNLYAGQDFLFDFDTGDVNHQLLLGANVMNKRKNGRSTFTSAASYMLDPTTTNTHIDIDKLTPVNESQIKAGFQAQDVMSWKGLSFLAGLRADWHDGVNHVHAWTYSPRFGLSYDILEEGWAILYANASINDTPNFNYAALPGDTSSKTKKGYLDSTWRAVQKEVGLRVNPVGSLWAQVALFQINQSNAPIAVGSGDDSYYVADGKTESKGIEFSLSGNITDNWSIYASYAYSHYTGQSINSSGANNTYSTSYEHFDRYPPHAISVWTSYKAPWFYDAVFGFGARWRDGWLMTFRGAKAGEDQVAKSLLTFDASIDFPFTENFSCGLALRNIFDTRGIESARNLQAFANDGRTIELSMRYRF